MRRFTAFLLLWVLLFSPSLADRNGFAQDERRGGLPDAGDRPAPPDDLGQAIPDQAITDLLDAPIDSTGIAATNQWVSSLGIAEWLGPLAPVALSPFFGITLLSGLSLWGPDWVTNNAMIGSSSVLRSQLLFAVFLCLTVLTSLPRFTKVSKPLAQAVDRLEAYSVIIILLTVKLVAVTQSQGDEPVAMVQFGMIQVSIDTLLAIAMIINILVINTVKFFFEFVVWLTPVPMLDAIFEVCNKSVCAGLMAVYAFSPAMATVINLCLLLVALIAFRWVNRRVRFYRTMLLDPVIAWLWPAYGRAEDSVLIVFPKESIGPFPAKSRLRLYGANDEPGGWILQDASWWRPDRKYRIPADTRAVVELGWIMNRVDFTQTDGTSCQLSFSRRYDGGQLYEMIQELRVQLSDKHVEPTHEEMRYEFS
jgi:hypothetical protein